MKHQSEHQAEHDPSDGMAEFDAWLVALFAGIGVAVLGLAVADQAHLPPARWIGDVGMAVFITAGVKVLCLYYRDDIADALAARPDSRVAAAVERVVRRGVVETVVAALIGIAAVVSVRF